MKYSKVEKLLLKAIEQAGYSTEGLNDLYVQKASFFSFGLTVERKI
jgi:hypothetical protein